MDLVQGRNILVVAQQVVEIGLDLVVALLEFAQDREDSHRVLAAQRQLGHAAHDHVRQLEIEVLERLLRQPDVLGQVEAALLADALRRLVCHDRGPEEYEIRYTFILPICLVQVGTIDAASRGRRSQFPTSSLGKHVTILNLRYYGAKMFRFADVPLSLSGMTRIAGRRVFLRAPSMDDWAGMGRIAGPQPGFSHAVGTDLARGFAGPRPFSPPAAPAGPRMAGGRSLRAVRLHQRHAAGWSAASTSATSGAASPRPPRSATGWASPMPARA